MKLLVILELILLLAVSFGCEHHHPTGFLLVNAPGDGNFEIYRVDSESPLQFVAEEIGKFNQPTKLPVGSYLILADCSHKMVNISSHTTERLVAHSVLFSPPTQPGPEDKFSIQCDRFSKTKSRQNIKNRFKLNLLHGKRDLLVGMVPLHINFFDIEGANNPKTLSFELSGIKLDSYPKIKPKTLYFVSPSDNLISVTENQEFGHWLYLLPGKYVVEVNGTKKEIDLKKSESLNIKPGFIQISTSKDLNIDLSSNILGTPLYVVLNDNHWLDLNETYPVLPGKGQLKLNNSISPITVQIVEDQLIHKKAKSVTIESDCSPWDWNCLGRRKIFLYQGNLPFAFTEGITDVPILFFEENVWVSIQGSRDIRYRLNNEDRDIKLKSAEVKLIPKHFHRPGQVTDLVRIEASKLPAIGHTLDLPLESEITVPLIEGKYFLGQYISSFSQEYERRNIRRIINAVQGRVPEIHYKVFVSEKKLRLIQKNQAMKNMGTKPKKPVNTQLQGKDIIPIIIF